MSGIVDQLIDVAKTNDGDSKTCQKDDFVINSRSDRKGSSDCSSRWISFIDKHCARTSWIRPTLHSAPFQKLLFQGRIFRNGKGILGSLDYKGGSI